MYKIKYSIVIAALIYFLTTTSVKAGYCSNIPNSGNYTISAGDTGCYIAAAGELTGLDDSGGSASSTTNTAVLTISANTSLTIPSAVSGTTTLAVGSISLGSGSSIVIGSNAQIKLNQPIWYVDADGDGAPTSAGASLTKPTNGIRRSYLTRVATTDCDDVQSGVYYTHSACYWDLDGDTYTGGNTNGPTCLNASSCTSATSGNLATGAAPTTYTAGRLRDSASGTDCDDNNVAITGSIQAYTDADSDTYGASGSALVDTGSCGSVPAGYATRLGDCADNNANVHWNSTTCSGTSFTDYLSATSYDYDCNGTPAKCGTIYDVSSGPTVIIGKRCIGTKSTGCGNQNLDSFSVAVSYACGDTGYIASATATRQTTCTTRTSTCSLGGNQNYSSAVTSGTQTCQ